VVGDLAIFGFGEGGWGLALLDGAAMTLLVSACGLLIGAAIGGLVAWARLSGKLLAGGVGQAYAALFRGLPELLIVYFVYFGTSTLLTETALFFGHEGFVGVPAFAAGSLAVGVISGAYQAEVFRAAYLAISRGELEAAVSVGMNRALMARRIILPQVLRCYMSLAWFMRRFRYGEPGRQLLPHGSPARNASRWCLAISLRRPAFIDPSWPVRSRSWMSSLEMPSSSAASSGL